MDLSEGLIWGKLSGNPGFTCVYHEKDELLHGWYQVRDTASGNVGNKSSDGFS